MTTVFFLFLVHGALGLLVMLPFVTEQAGTKYFKFNAAAASFMMTAAVGLVYRRWGWTGGPGAPGGESYPALLAVVGASLVFTMLYNRARHFGWSPVQPWLLAAALLAGAGSIVLGAPADNRGLVISADLASIWLLGAAASAMILGHWYLVILDLPIRALRVLTLLLVAGLGLRTVTVAIALAGPVHAAYDGARQVAFGLWSPDGVFVWMRLLFGIAGPLTLIWFIWKTVEIRSTQSATGILYVQLFLVLSGELLAKYMRIAAGFPL